MGKVSEIFHYVVMFKGDFLFLCSDYIYVQFIIGWIDFLSAGSASGAKGFSFFVINIDLTEEGMGNA